MGVVAPLASDRETAPMTVVGTLARINRFPVKSMQGEALDEVELTDVGIPEDRQWALRDIESGRIVSAKLPRRFGAILSCAASGTGHEARVRLPDGDELGIGDPALRIALEALFGRTMALEEAAGAPATYGSEWPEIEGLTLAGEIDFPTNLAPGTSGFVDVDVLHILTTASLAELARRGDVDADERRFRPSLLIDTGDAAGFVEHDWEGATLRVGDAEILVGDATPRCVMTTVAQPGLERDAGVLQAIAAHNRRSNDFGTFACLGAYATVARPGRIRTGDEVTIG